MGYLHGLQQQGLGMRAAKEGLALFQRFHCFPAPSVVRVRCQRVMPEVLVRIGELRGLIYSSDRGSKGCPRTFIHFMQRPPMLACNAEGTQIYVLGGRYRVTGLGIEG